MNAAATISKRDRVLGGLWGSLVGDALGVPVEFKDRATIQADPVTDKALPRHEEVKALFNRFADLTASAP